MLFPGTGKQAVAELSWPSLLSIMFTEETFKQQLETPDSVTFQKQRLPNPQFETVTASGNRASSYILISNTAANHVLS